jgi:RNA polymerase-binding transcription factor DksA
MPREDDRRSKPRWRSILEARWRLRLQEVTELSVAYHAATADAWDGIKDRRARQLLHQAIAARQRLADTEEALGRVAAGDFGRCEQCAAPIDEVLLAAAPEARYCLRCAAGTPAVDTATGATMTGGTAPGRAAAGTLVTGTAAGRR